MAKRKSPAKKAAPATGAPQLDKINNGLGNVLMGFGYDQGINVGQFGSQLSQTDTLYKNIRGYLVSNMRTLLSMMYVEHGVVETAIDIPVEDALRGGIEIKTGQLSEDEIAELLSDMEDNGDFEVAKQAEKWKRLFGGAAVMIMTEQLSAKPINIKAMTEGSLLEFKAVDMWELYWNQIKDYTEDKTTEIDPIRDRLNEQSATLNYYSNKIHKTRLIMMKGKEAPSFLRPQLRGWGLSEVEAIVRSINQYLKSTDLSFEVLDEFKLDIFKIAGLISSLGSPQGEALVARRLALANSQKNYQNALAMDATDDYVQKQLSFSGLAEVMKGIKEQIASDLRMPLTKLFGMSSAGFNSGEDDIENYNAMVESRVRPSLKRTLTKMIKLRCKVKFGFVPSDLKMNFKSLRVMSSTDEETVKTSKFNRAIQATQAGEMTSEEFRETCNKDELFAIKLDPSVDVSSLKRELIPGADPDEEPEDAPEERDASPKQIAAKQNRRGKKA